MESTKASEETSVSVIREDVAESRPPAGLSPLGRIRTSLDAATSNLDDARKCLQRLAETIEDGATEPLNGQPALLTVPQVCRLLGYHKTKVYGLMQRGLLPYVLDRRTGRRRVEYRAIQRFVKRLRASRLERSAS
jgi:excisionase family DNA binding protein